MSTDSKLEALRTGLEMAQELLEIKREALGDDYRLTRTYWEAERELQAALAEAEQEQAGEAVAVPNLDPDGDTSRAGFAAMDAELVARWMSPWQVWREAVRWSTGQRAIHGITKEPKT